MLKKKPMYQPPSRVLRQQFTHRVRNLANTLAVYYGVPVDVNEIIADLGRERIVSFDPEYMLFMPKDRVVAYQGAIARRYQAVTGLKEPIDPAKVEILYRGLLHVHAVIDLGNGKRQRVKVVDTTIFEGTYVLPTAKNHLLTGRHLDLVRRNLDKFREVIGTQYKAYN